MASLLLTNGAAVNQATEDGATPLYMSPAKRATLRWLLCCSPTVQRLIRLIPMVSRHCTSPASINGGLALVQLLSSYDASRTLSNSKMAEQVVGLLGDNEVVD